MKKTIIINSLVMALGIGFIVFGCSKIHRQEPTIKEPVSIEYFKVGQILMPDYACPDTLIVRDAIGLNNGMALIEQGFIDATDYEIDSVLHTHCDYYIGSFEDQFSKIKAQYPSWDSLQIDQAIKED
ncbi:MAG: hypothetical protein V4547_18805 [Bacteroidota bacterium]